MSDQHSSPAVDLDRAPQARPGTPRGSAGLQMIASLVAPGLPSMRRVPVFGLVLFVAGAAGPLVLAAWAFSHRDDAVALALDPRVLTAVSVVGLALVLTRLFAIAEIAHAFRRSRRIGPKTFLATLAVLVLAAPVLFVSLRAEQTRSAVAAVFGREGGRPLFESTGDDADIDPSAVTTVLLLGGDAGPDRWGLRTDTMILVSIHEASGRTALVSVPRNLMRLRFPPGTPLAGVFPNGFDDLANALFPYVSAREDLLDFYGGTGRGEAVALASGIGFSLGIEIDDFALVDMQGFKDVIDAVGGVTLDLPQSVPLAGGVSGEPLPGAIGPGLIEMDGALAMAYVRSRSADSDYHRMERQRQLLAALGSQVSPSEAASGFSQVTGALDDAMRTSLSGGEFSGLLVRLGDSANIGESIGLVPPLVEPGRPDYDEIRQIIDAVERYVLTGQPSGFAG